MVKILSQSGDSLADTYNVVGSVAGIEQLETRELPIVHEMGATVFSERYSRFTRAIVSGDTLQTAAWDVIVDDLPAGIFQIYGIRVRVDVTARVNFCSVAARTVLTGREIPIWAWDSTSDGEIDVRWSDDGAGASAQLFLQPAVANVTLPYFMAGVGQRQQVRSIAFRGVTTTFGAGDVEATLFLDLGLTHVGGISSRGLPMPSW